MLPPSTGWFRKGVEAVQECDADVDFSGLAVRVSRHDALAEGLEPAHPRLDPDADVLSGPSLPERSAVMPCSEQGLVSGACRWAAFFHARPFFRFGMIGTASRSTMVLWQRRVS